MAKLESANWRGERGDVAKEMEEKDRPVGVRTSGTEPIVVVLVSHVILEARASAIFWVSAGRTVFPMRKHGFDWRIVLCGTG